MKHTFSVKFMAWVFVLLGCMVFYRAGAQTLYVGDMPATAAPGEVIDVPIYIGGAGQTVASTRGFSFVLDFDESVFETTLVNDIDVDYTGSVLGTPNTADTTGSGTGAGFVEDVVLTELANGVVQFNLAVLGSPLSNVSGLIGVVHLRVKDAAADGEIGIAAIASAQNVDDLFNFVDLGVGSDSTEVEASTAVLIWPGDANNDGIVNLLDFDLILQAWNPTLQGNPRASISNAWQGFDAPAPWGLETQGIDHMFIDANGDGFVSLLDLNAWAKNLGLTHN